MYRTRGEHANHYATDAVPYFYLFLINLFNQNFLLSLHSQNILHVDVLYNIKRKKYKTVCAELEIYQVTFDRMVIHNFLRPNRKVVADRAGTNVRK
jgi:hypothetical protein